MKTNVRPTEISSQEVRIQRAPSDSTTNSLAANKSFLSPTCHRRAVELYLRLDLATANPTGLAPIPRDNAVMLADQGRMLRRLLVRQILQKNIASGWRISTSCALSAMMLSSARARMRCARRSRVFGNRPGTDPCLAPIRPIVILRAPKIRLQAKVRNRLNPKI